MIRYAVTAIKSDGNRMLAFDNTRFSNYEDRKDAEAFLKNVLLNNSSEGIASSIGKDLRIDPVDCWDSGEAKRIIITS